MSYLAEQNVIGSLLMDNKSMVDIYGTLSPEMFTQPILASVFHEFQRGYDKRYHVDLVVLEQNLRSEDLPTSVLIETLTSCMAVTSTSASIKEHAKVIANDYNAEVLSNFLSRTVVTPNNLEAVLRDITEQVDVIRGEKREKSKTLSEIAAEIKDQYFKEKEVQPIKIGFDKLDDLLGGLEGGDMIVIGARPAVGKSAFVTQITRNLSEQGKRVGFFNLEMQTKQVYERFMAAESGIKLTRLRKAIGFLGDEKERFDKANKKFEDADNIVITTGSKSVSEIRAESLHMDYDIIVIDYLQLLRTEVSYRGNRTAEVGAISKAIKSLAMELNIPIIALSQLNRGSEVKEIREPSMSELREAGDIEQDASVVILLWNVHQDDYTRKGCKIEKNRQGRVGKEVLEFDGDMMRFTESKEEYSEAVKWKKSGKDNPFDEGGNLNGKVG